MSSISKRGRRLSAPCVGAALLRCRPGSHRLDGHGRVRGSLACLRCEGGQGERNGRGEINPGHGIRRGFWKSIVIFSGEQSRLSPLPGSDFSSRELPGARTLRGRRRGAAALSWPLAPALPQRLSGIAVVGAVPALLPSLSLSASSPSRVSIPGCEHTAVCPKPCLLGNSWKQDRGGNRDFLSRQRKARRHTDPE